MPHHQSEIDRSMEILERLALTLNVSVRAFFEPGTTAGPAGDACDIEVAELNRAFRAITDPNVRRYCIDFVTAAGSEEEAGRSDPVTPGG